MSTAGGSDLIATLGVEPTSPVTEIDVDAADGEQSDVERAESADEVKYGEAAPVTMVGGADALELAYHAARGVEPTEAWGKSSVEAYEQYATILARCACEAMHMVMTQMGARGGGGEENDADTQRIAIGKFFKHNYVSIGSNTEESATEFGSASRCGDAQVQGAAEHSGFHRRNAR